MLLEGTFDADQDDPDYLQIAPDPDADPGPDRAPVDALDEPDLDPPTPTEAA